VAHLYDDSYRDAYWQWHDALTWDYLKPHLPRDMNGLVLDLGCGTGKWALKLLKSGFKVVCVDISAKMLDEARRNIQEAGLAARAEFVQADLCDLACLSGRDAALAVAFGEAIGCTASPLDALKQIRRTLGASGMLVATFDNRLAAIDYYLSSGDPEKLVRFLRDGRTHWLTKDAAERFEITTYGPTELCKLVEAAGFHVVDLVGKTVLPMRQHRAILEDSAHRRVLARLEKELSRDPGAIGRAAHLQVACRVR
jgi:ubiquinone/menaquinone biosynthesis C-methylase UbiE